MLLNNNMIHERLALFKDKNLWHMLHLIVKQIANEPFIVMCINGTWWSLHNSS
jgi:hypothetical protein